MKKSRIATCFLAACAVAVILQAAPVAAAKVEIVQAADAPELEKLAARELAAYVQRLTDAEASSVSKLSPDAAQAILVGSPATNVEIKRLVGDTWPKLTAQGIVLRSVKLRSGEALVVGGGSAVATLWAVHELAQRWGVVHLLSGSNFPEDKQALQLAGLDVKLEPAIERRAWQTVGSGVLDGVSWPLADQQKLIDQLARLKFNHLILKVNPAQPFLTSPLDEQENPQQFIRHGEEFPVAGDTPGRTAFAGAEKFVNADLAAREPAAASEAAKKWLSGIIAAAQARGMTVELRVSALEMLVGNKTKFEIKLQPDPDGRLLLEPSDKTMSEAVEFAASALTAAAKRYPAADRIAFDYPRGVTFISAANEKFLEQLRASLPEDKRYHVPPAERLAALRRINLSDDHVGVVAQLPLTSLAVQIDDISGQKDATLELSAGVLGELDVAVLYASRAAFEPSLTPRRVALDMLTTLTGQEDSAQRIWRAWEAMDNTTQLLAKVGGELTASSGGAQAVAPAGKPLFDRLYSPAPLPDYFAQLTADNGVVVEEIYRGRSNCLKRGTGVLYYYAKRGEYGSFYLAMVEALRAAATAKQQGDLELAIEKLEAAIEALNDGMETLADVVQYPSDRALIALLAARLYRPLQAEYERLLDAAENAN